VLLRRFTTTLCVLLALATSAKPQSYQALKSFTTAAVAADDGVRLIGSGVSFHKLTWTVSGTVSTCSVRVDSSSDGVSWGTGDIIAAQTCTSGGASTVANFTVNYVRINVTTLTGGGSINAVYTGYINNPSGGGSGISSLNGLTGATQTFAAGTAGTDFTIDSSGTTHTFNIPDASASARGLLTSADWSTFNGKLSSVSLDQVLDPTTDKPFAMGGFYLDFNGLPSLGVEDASFNVMIGGVRANGDQASNASVSGGQNVGVGPSVFRALTSGSNSVAVGSSALLAVSTGINNTAVGAIALSSTESSANTAVGMSAGAALNTGNGNTFLGAFADTGSANITNATAIGNGAVVTASNTMRFGNSSVTEAISHGIYHSETGLYAGNDLVAGADLQLTDDLPNGGIAYMASLAPSQCVATDANKKLISTGARCSDASTTAANCSSSASPAVCGSAQAGSFVIAASGTTVTVNTSAVTANSQIFVQEDESLGTKLGVTCNTGILANPPAITARTPGTSFGVAISVGLAVNPVCFSYLIMN